VIRAGAQVKDRAVRGRQERRAEVEVRRRRAAVPRYREVAEALNASSVNAARLIVARALIKLAKTVRSESAENEDGSTRSAE